MLTPFFLLCSPLQAINIGYQNLVKEGLVMDDDDSDDEINYADECGIEW